MTNADRIGRIWAPWRMAFIKKARSKKSRGCFFCDYAREKKDRRNQVLLRGRHCFAVMNKYPYTTGHLLIAPLAHKANLADLTPAEQNEIFDLLVRCQKALVRGLKSEGFNVGANLGKVAGAGVPGHLHVHLVPRWEGDNNFMGTVGSIRVLPDSLERVYGSLQKALGKGR